MKSILKLNRFFLFPYLLFFLLGGLVLLINNKAAIHLEFNSFHTPFLDGVFTYLTYLGDGWTATIIGVLFLVIRLRWAFIIGFACIFSAFVAQFLKHSVFPDALRPVKYFEGTQQLYLVPGVDMNLYNSFPSGHTTCAFALYLSLAFFSSNNTVKFLLFLLAILVGYSRIYLSQHFLEDVFAGAFIGVSSALIAWWLFERSRSNWMDKNLISVFQS